jgi:hypothetical protein
MGRLKVGWREKLNDKIWTRILSQQNKQIKEYNSLLYIKIYTNLKIKEKKREKILGKMDEKTTPRLTRLFVVIDDLCKQKKIGKKERRGRESGLCVSEILAIQIWLNLSKCRDFKTFYRG